MSVVDTTLVAAPTAPGPDVIADKGLRTGVIGLLGSAVLGVVQTAPAYSIAVTLSLPPSLPCRPAGARRAAARLHPRSCA